MGHPRKPDVANDGSEPSLSSMLLADPLLQATMVVGLGRAERSAVAEQLSRLDATAEGSVSLRRLIEAGARSDGAVATEARVILEERFARLLGERDDRLEAPDDWESERGKEAAVQWWREVATTASRLATLTGSAEADHAWRDALTRLDERGDDEPDLWALLANDRFVTWRRAGDRSALDESIQLAERSLDATSDEDGALAATISERYWSRYRERRDVRDGDTSVRFAQIALDASGDDPAVWARRANNVAIRLIELDRKDPRPERIDWAKALLEAALIEAPDSPERLRWVLNLAQLLGEDYVRTGQAAELAKAEALFAGLDSDEDPDAVERSLGIVTKLLRRRLGAHPEEPQTTAALDHLSDQLAHLTARH